MTLNESRFHVLSDEIAVALDEFGTAKYLANRFCEMDATEQIGVLVAIAECAEGWDAPAESQWYAIGHDARKMPDTNQTVRRGIDVLRQILAAYDEGESNA